MLQIDAWKRITIWLTVIIGLGLAFPNFFYGRVEQANDARAEIEVLGANSEREAAAAG